MNGVKDGTFRWFPSYLTNKYQYVDMEEVQSEISSIILLSHRDPFWVHVFLFHTSMISGIRNQGIFIFNTTKSYGQLNNTSLQKHNPYSRYQSNISR